MSSSYVSPINTSSSKNFIAFTYRSSKFTHSNTAKIVTEHSLFFILTFQQTLRMHLLSYYIINVSTSSTSSLKLLFPQFRPNRGYNKRFVQLQYHIHFLGLSIHKKFPKLHIFFDKNLFFSLFLHSLFIDTIKEFHIYVPHPTHKAPMQKNMAMMIPFPNFIIFHSFHCFDLYIYNFILLYCFLFCQF